MYLDGIDGFAGFRSESPDAPIGPAGYYAPTIGEDHDAVGLSMRRSRYVQNLPPTHFVYIAPDSNPVLSASPENLIEFPKLNQAGSSHFHRKFREIVVVPWKRNVQNWTGVTRRQQGGIKG